MRVSILAALSLVIGIGAVGQQPVAIEVLPVDDATTNPNVLASRTAGIDASSRHDLESLTMVQAHLEPTYLNPNRPHILLHLERDREPDISLYATAKLSGPPAIRLTGAGLFFRNRLVCTWPGGHYDGTRVESMVLGYADKDLNDYRGCRHNLPIRSVWLYADGDEVARLFIEVTRRRGPIVEVRQGRITYYLDLNTLPGDPRVADPTYRVRMKGFGTWEWVESANETERQEAAAVARLRKDVTFSRFLREVRACLSSPAVPDCFAQFVKTEFYYPGLWASTGQPYNTTPKAFVDFVWRESNASGYGLRPWDELVACFTVGRMTDASKDRVRFETDARYCDVARLDGRWLLEDFSARP